MHRWELLICHFPEIPCYHMRPDDAWNLPLPAFRHLSDTMIKIFDKWSAGS